MLQKPIITIIENFKQEIKEKTEQLYKKLLTGDLLGFEQELEKETAKLYNEIAFTLIDLAANSSELEEKARIAGQKKGLTAIRKTEVELQLKTGEKRKITSLYAARALPKNGRKRKRGPNGSGSHLLLDYWGCIDKASPCYYSYVTMLSILCPSFEIVLRVLENQSIQADYKRMRSLAYQVGNKCFADRITIGLQPGETLAGKRVILSVDGGRSRTRVENPNKKPCKTSKGKRAKFNTPWREPKLFVIHVLDEDGNCAKTELPIYDGLVNKPEPFFALLSSYLKHLHIQDAREIIFIADGALWIWNRVTSLFRDLAVDEQKITQAIDFYHAVQHISSILRIFSDKQLNRKQKKAWFNELKSDLYHGRVTELISKATSLANGRQRILSEIDYFVRNIQRMNYPLLRRKKLPIGSGIIESAIRRIINLRFKSPSTFWHTKSLEKLIFLRAIFLSKRWNIMIANLTQKNSMHASIRLAS
jgi:hypothetical protein